MFFCLLIQDSWKGRDLLNFVNKKDTGAVSSKLTNDFGDVDDLPENKGKNFLVINTKLSLNFSNKNNQFDVST